MTLQGDYAPSPRPQARDDVTRIEAAGDTNVVDRQGRPVVVVTMRGARTGALRKVPLMRVEHDGVLVIVASQGGAPEHPQWYWNLRADPDVEVQDGTTTFAARARELEGKERFDWWVRAVEAFPPYAEYQVRTQRLIPLFLLEPR
ncbi:MAG TPA: nitroreductase family deazaflavin-dependent oxidoreductase [Lapillicoccus sp.]|jgi:deazaflavin-dependent oxidoreductase (nitroreductase family)|uniref:nitroreductase family deazaflavin-dependent oxidoreductase n=1 Tax=Lapillicoccus sp. TaxID=1909287 RepID=UPI002F9598B4